MFYSKLLDLVSYRLVECVIKMIIYENVCSSIQQGSCAEMLDSLKCSNYRQTVNIRTILCVLQVLNDTKLSHF